MKLLHELRGKKSGHVHIRKSSLSKIFSWCACLINVNWRNIVSFSLSFINSLGILEMGLGFFFFHQSIMLSVSINCDAKTMKDMNAFHLQNTTIHSVHGILLLLVIKYKFFAKEVSCICHPMKNIYEMTLDMDWPYLWH